MLDTGRRLPLVLPVVLYNGETPWKASNQLAALIQPAERALTPYQPSQLHYVRDERHMAEEDLPRSNLVTAMLHVERIESPSDLIGVVDVLRARFRRPEDNDLRRAFTDWVRRIAQRLVPGGEKLAAQVTLEDMQMTVVERVSEWPKQWFREGHEQGMREGLEQGRSEERARLRRMAASRFGAEAAERLSAVLADVADPEGLARWASGWCAARPQRNFSPARNRCGARGWDAGVDARGSRRLRRYVGSSEGLFVGLR